MDTMFSDEEKSATKRHKEEGQNRQMMDAADRQKVKDKINQHTHPLNPQSDKLINIINGKVAGVHIGSKMAFDMETLYSRILIISQKRSISLEKVFRHELSAMPYSLFDEYGEMHKGNKALLMTKLPVLDDSKFTPDVEIIDGNQLLYHVLWPDTHSKYGTEN